MNDHLPTALADIPTAAAAATPTACTARTPAPFVLRAPCPAERLRLAAAAAGVTALWAIVLIASQRFTISRGFHHPVVALHLISLTVGFGAVLAVDVCALNGLLRRHDFTLADALKAAAVVDPLIWVGYAGLILSGLLLHPDLTEPLMWVKLVAGLAAGINGVNAKGLPAALADLPRATRLSDLPRPFAVRAVAAATFSQLAWWTAILIGFFGI
ncbi:hypothetical protein [Actinospica sp.]|uniref:hypothetical protein n=1 Tax=Actinospica sp. TaxID=1872142 RepID=UPI002B678C54|nr:hypothetical protein [Actinospica sp.]HWG23396.1 hypothetical protein [Actinospica sp.]